MSHRLMIKAAKKLTLTSAVVVALATGGFINVANAADDGSLTWNGITFYGVVDVGVAYQTHGAPLSQDWGVGLDYLLQKQSNKSITSVAPNGLSQSRLGLKGIEPVAGDTSFIFNLEMGFDPQSGNLADGLQSLVHNNGVPLANQTSGADTSRDGQFFNGAAYAGLSSPTWGTFTLGRQNAITLDNILKYDPMGGSYAFSIIGFSGVAGGGGDTEDARLDDSIKYVYKYDMFHLGLLYQFGKTDSSPGEAWQGDLGFDYEGFSVDGAYSHKKDAISAASLSAAQVAELPVGSLAATISDNTAYQLLGSYTTGPLKAFLGYEHLRYENPTLPIEAGFSGLGGYYFSVVNNAAFPTPKVLQISWGGLKYSISPQWELTGALYHYDQNSYAVVHCNTATEGTCSGSEDVYSLMTDYHWTNRFDTYAGVMFSKVSDGLAAGYLHTSTADPMLGFRFKF